MPIAVLFALLLLLFAELKLKHPGSIAQPAMRHAHPERIAWLRK